MKREEINAHLYNQYTNTGNVNFLHQIISDYDELIYKCIDETFKENEIKNVTSQECYSCAYYHIFKNLERMNDNKVDVHRIGLYIKKWAIGATLKFIEEEKLLDDKTICVRDFYESDPYYKEEIEELIINEERKKYIPSYMKKLTPREKEAIDLLYGLNEEGNFMSSSRVAQKMGISLSRVHQLENNAFKWMAHEIAKGALENHPIMIQEDTIRKHFGKLDYYEQRIISLYLGLNSKGLILDVLQIAKQVEMCESMVEYIRSHAIAKLYYFARADYYENKSNKLKRK